MGIMLTGIWVESRARMWGIVKREHCFTHDFTAINVMIANASIGIEGSTTLRLMMGLHNM